MDLSSCTSSSFEPRPVNGKGAKRLAAREAVDLARRLTPLVTGTSGSTQQSTAVALIS